MRISKANEAVRQAPGSHVARCRAVECGTVGPVVPNYPLRHRRRNASLVVPSQRGYAGADRVAGAAAGREVEQ
jgi:hypothetical protein